MHSIVSKSVVITGSTRGIGYNLATAFLERGCVITVSGRTSQAVNEVVKKMGTKYAGTHIYGCTCDVTDFPQVQKLWDEVKQHLLIHHRFR